MLLTHSKQALSCRTLIGCGVFIFTIVLNGCGTFSTKPGPSKVSQFKQDTSVGTEDISIAALGLVDVPYRYGGNTPKGGFDCSGLIVYVYSKAVGIKLPRTTHQLNSPRQLNVNRFVVHIDDEPTTIESAFWAVAAISIGHIH